MCSSPVASGRRRESGHNRNTWLWVLRAYVCMKQGQCRAAAGKNVLCPRRPWSASYTQVLPPRTRRLRGKPCFRFYRRDAENAELRLGFALAPSVRFLCRRGKFAHETREKRERKAFFACFACFAGSPSQPDPPSLGRERTQRPQKRRFCGEWWISLRSIAAVSFVRGGLCVRGRASPPGPAHTLRGFAANLCLA